MNTPASSGQTVLKAAGLIRTIPDFPQQGILFRDITPVLADGEAFSEVLDRLTSEARAMRPDKVLGIESRGFLVGGPVALALGIGFVPARKDGKLPYDTVRAEYSLEYGVNVIELHKDAVKPGERVLIVDDLLATGGTARAAADLVHQLGGEVAGFLFFIELTELGGREQLKDQVVRSLVQF